MARNLLTQKAADLGFEYGHRQAKAGADGSYISRIYRCQEIVAMGQLGFRASAAEVHAFCEAATEAYHSWRKVMLEQAGELDTRHE